MLSTLYSFNPLFLTPSSTKRPPTPLLLELCSSPPEPRRLLPLLIKQGLFVEHLVQTKLVAHFSRFGALDEASLVFSSVSDKSEELYHSVLKGHCHHSPLPGALCFFPLKKQAQVRPSVYSFNYLLKACSDDGEHRRGKEIHSQLIAHGFGSNVYAMTAVGNMYVKCRRIEQARKMFDRMPGRDLVAWNAVVTGYAQNGLATDALEIVARMQEEGRMPDPITLVSALPPCADAKCLRTGRSVHGFVIWAGFEHLMNVSTALLDMYAKCGAIVSARLVFDRLRAKNVVSWNSMIDGDAEEAMRLYKRMLAAGIKVTDANCVGRSERLWRVGRS